MCMESNRAIYKTFALGYSRTSPWLPLPIHVFRCAPRHQRRRRRRRRRHPYATSSPRYSQVEKPPNKDVKIENIQSPAAKTSCAKALFHMHKKMAPSRHVSPRSKPRRCLESESKGSVCAAVHPKDFNRYTSLPEGGIQCPGLPSASFHGPATCRRRPCRPDRYCRHRHGRLSCRGSSRPPPDLWV